MDTHETKVYIAFLIIAGVVGIFLIFFIITILRHQRRNQLIHQEKIQAEIELLEKERNRIASDLHDDLGPLLSTAKLLINNVELPVAEDRETLTRASRYIDEAVTQLKTISNNLIPQVLLEKGFVAALHEYITEQNEKRPMQVTFEHGPDLYIPAAQGIHLYRILYEVIHNANKHATASGMQIRLEEKNQQWILTMKDNGQGFDTRDPRIAQKGLGLKNISSRVETLKGTLYLQSVSGRGTNYSIEIPLLLPGSDSG